MNKYDPGGKNGGITFDDFVKMLQESHEAGKEADSLTKSNVPALKREIKRSFEEKAKEVIKTCGAQIESEVGEKAVKAIKSDTAKSFSRQELGKANTLILEQIQTSFNELIQRVESILDKEGARHMAGVKAVRAKCFKDSAERVMKFKRMQREAAASSRESQVKYEQETSERHNREKVNYEREKVNDVCTCAGESETRTCCWAGNAADEVL